MAPPQQDNRKMPIRIFVNAIPAFKLNENENKNYLK